MNKHETKAVTAFKNLWESDIFNHNTENEPIRATFSSGRTVDYTANILPLLMRDDNCIEIMSLETGELYKY